MCGLHTAAPNGNAKRLLGHAAVCNVSAWRRERPVPWNRGLSVGGISLAN
jgi:hypothetical protein